MSQPPVHLGLVAVTANVLDTTQSPATSALPDGNVQLLLVLKTDAAPNISPTEFMKLVEAELDHLETGPKCVVTAKDLQVSDGVEKPASATVK